MQVMPFARSKAGATSTMSMPTIRLRRASARSSGASWLEAQAAWRRGHDRRHLRRVDAVRVDREVDGAALGDGREDRVGALGMELLGRDQARAVGARGLDLAAARAADRAQADLGHARRRPASCSPSAAGCCSRGARRPPPRASPDARRCAGRGPARPARRGRRAPGW